MKKTIKKEDDNNKLSLIAVQKKSKLDKLILYEKIDTNLLNKLITSSLLQEIENDLTKNTFKHEKEQLTKYLSLIKCTDKDYLNMDFDTIQEIERIQNKTIKNKITHQNGSQIIFLTHSHQNKY